MPRRHLSEPEVARALGMLEAGLGQRRVAQTMGVSHSVISRVNQRHQETGLYSETPRSGRPVLTTPRDDRYLMNLCLRNRFHSARRLNNDFAAATGVIVSTQTIRNRLHRANMHARRPAQCVPLTPAHGRIRLNWAREHEEVILDIELTERHSHIHLYHFTSSADAPIDPLFRMWDDVRDIMQQLNPSMCEIDYSVFEDIQDSCVWCIPTGGRRRSRQHFFYATRVNQTGSLRRILRRYFQNGDSRVNTREHGESKRWKNIYFVIINCIFCCNFQSLTFAVLGWCLRTLNSPSGYGHVHVQVFKVPPLYKRQLNAVQLVYSLFWGVLSFNVQGMSKMS
ncbi:hypothetical protein GQR58_016621 [Nymphon striatum]|nr:hypothetical protein GQR58_016621 [Nymphon striatum]